MLRTLRRNADGGRIARPHDPTEEEPVDELTRAWRITGWAAFVGLMLLWAWFVTELLRGLLCH